MNIFVAKLDYNTQSDEVRELFEQYGTVDSANVITDRESGRSKGFAFVEMPDDSAAQAAITALDGTTLGGRQIAVKKAEPRENRGGGGGGFNRGGGGGGGFRKFDNRGGGGGGGRSFDKPRNNDRWNRDY